MDNVNANSRESTYVMLELLLCTPAYSAGACNRLDSVGKITLVSGIWAEQNFRRMDYKIGLYSVIYMFMMLYENRAK